LNLYRLYKLEFLAFVRSGVIYPHHGTAGYVGEWGWGWSRTVQSIAYAYFLDMNPGDVGPSNSSYRWHGFPLRCLYPGSA